MPADVSSLRKWAADLRKAGATAGARARVVVAKTAHDVEATAKELAPVDTGNLMNGIGVDMFGNATTARAVVGPTADYAPPVEFGHVTKSGSFVPPQPFMAPAADAHEQAFYAAMETLGVQGLE